MSNVSHHNMRHLVPLLLGLTSAIAAAQAPIPSPTASAPSTGTLVKVRAISLRPSDANYYPAALSVRGVQGTTLVQAELSETGAPTAVAVFQSSRSAELDAAALAVVRAVTYKAKEPAAQPSQVLVPVEFLRDSVATLGQKTCSEFTIDAQYFKTAFPEVDMKEMMVVSMAIGVLFMGRGAATDAVTYAKSLSSALPRVVEACASQREARFLEAFKRVAQGSGG